MVVRAALDTPVARTPPPIDARIRDGLRAALDGSPLARWLREHGAAEAAWERAPVQWERVERLRLAAAGPLECDVVLKSSARVARLHSLVAVPEPFSPGELRGLLLALVDTVVDDLARAVVPLLTRTPHWRPSDLAVSIEGGGRRQVFEGPPGRHLLNPDARHHLLDAWLDRTAA